MLKIWYSYVESNDKEFVVSVSFGTFRQRRKENEYLDIDKIEQGLNLKNKKKWLKHSATDFSISIASWIVSGSATWFVSGSKIHSTPTTTLTIANMRYGKAGSNFMPWTGELNNNQYQCHRHRHRQLLLRTALASKGARTPPMLPIVEQMPTETLLVSVGNSSTVKE